MPIMPINFEIDHKRPEKNKQVFKQLGEYLNTASFSIVKKSILTEILNYGNDSLVGGVFSFPVKARFDMVNLIFKAIHFPDLLFCRCVLSQMELIKGDSSLKKSLQPITQAHYTALLAPHSQQLNFIFIGAALLSLFNGQAKLTALSIQGIAWSRKITEYRIEQSLQERWAKLLINENIEMTAIGKVETSAIGDDFEPILTRFHHITRRAIDSSLSFLEYYVPALKTPENTSPQKKTAL